jgi:phage internal scaffolding protein
MEFQTAYGANKKPVIKPKKGEPVLTEQAHKDECDMNRILDKYQKTGFIEHAKKHEGRYDDVTNVDFQEAMNVVANVKSMFEELPSKFRAEFENNPGKFLEFAQNPQNAEKMHKMGILLGNDGFDIRGAAIMTPTEAGYALQKEQELAAAEPVAEPGALPSGEQTSP